MEKNLYQIQSKEVQDKSTWDIVSQMGNDLMTINGSELPRRVSSLLKGLIRRQKANFVILAQNRIFG